MLSSPFLFAECSNPIKNCEMIRTANFVIHHTPSGCHLNPLVQALVPTWSPTSGWVKMTIIQDHHEALALSQELSALLAKGAIEPVHPSSQSRNYYLTQFLEGKNDSRLHPVLDLRGINKF